MSQLDGVATVALLDGREGARGDDPGHHNFIFFTILIKSENFIYTYLLYGQLGTPIIKIIPPSLCAWVTTTQKVDKDQAIHFKTQKGREKNPSHFAHRTYPIGKFQDFFFIEDVYLE